MSGIVRRRQVFTSEKEDAELRRPAAVHSRWFTPERGSMPTETGASDLPDFAVRAQLDSILASAIFSRSPQLRRFLSFIVEQTLAGHGSRLKEAVLAHELYGKGTDFDAGNDPVVRVDARRLRDKLREFYEGRSEPIVISLPKGSYVPVFEARSTPRAALPETRPVTHRTRPGVVLGVLAFASIGAMTVVAWRALHMPADTSAELLPLASYPGPEGAPALSPDGKSVAFAWPGQDSGPTDIYVKAVTSEALRRLTETPDSESNPAWSPEGQEIAFVREAQGVFTMSQLGGTERRVSASGTHVAWADSNSLLIRDREGDTGPFAIYQVFLDTLERRRLTQPSIGAGDWRFEVSPDARTLAFIRYQREGIADLYTVPMAGGEPRRLSDWNAALTGLSWTPNGREIVYSVEGPTASRLWRIHSNSAAPNRGSPLIDIPTSAANPSISRPLPGEPARLAFQSVTRDVDIELMDLEARPGNDGIEAKPFAVSTRVESSAQFSPDGARIAFASQRSGTPELWIARRDGDKLEQITSLGAAELVVGGWSPDGASVVFDATVAGNSDLYVVGAQGGRVRRLTSEPSIEGLSSWSADNWIYFSSTRAGAIPDVWRITPAGGAAERMTRNGGFGPQPSSDGSYLFYLDRYPQRSAINPTARLMRLSLAGGQEELMLERVRPFAWAVTGTGIVFVTSERDFDAFDLYRFSDRRIARVGRLGFRIPGIFNHLAVSRDGRWALATQLVRFESDLMRLDNFH
jgi:Tol biopolymer transport system component